MNAPPETKINIARTDGRLNITFPPKKEFPAASKGMFVIAVVAITVFGGAAYFNIVLACGIFVFFILPVVILAARDRHRGIALRKHPTADHLKSTITIIPEGIEFESVFYPFCQNEGPSIGEPACHVIDQSIERVLYIPIVTSASNKDRPGEPAIDAYEIWCQSQEEADWLLYEIELFLKHAAAKPNKPLKNQRDEYDRFIREMIEPAVEGE